MIVIVAEDVPTSIRGMLKRWFVEPRANVFVGSLNARTRDKAMAYVRRNAAGLRMLTIEDASNCQGYEIRSFGYPSRRPTVRSGLQLIIENPEDNDERGLLR